MTFFSSDLRKLGFKCGLEIHQRLDSRKLFCNCYANPSEDARAQLNKEDCILLTRRLAPVESELRELDRSALFEAGRQKEFVYHAPLASSCLVECDEEPAHEINPEALETALQASLSLNARLLEEIHVMRKQVLDGSAVSGFQRTALIATNGWLETSKGRVRVPSICLEEESSGIVEQTGEQTVFRLDRQGIPLVEIATDASLQDGGHARETAELIGLMLRNTGRVQRGIGTIRQDLNISIARGARVEIKGAQELAAIPALVENEVRRQLALVDVMQELRARGVGAGVEEVKDVTSLFKEARAGFVKKAVAEGKKVFALKLPGFAGLLARELMPDHRFGTELSHYARAAAGVRGITHSDEDFSKTGFSDQEASGLRGALDCGKNDAWVLCVGEPRRARRALQAVFERALLAAREVPRETRRAEGEKSVFLRPLPGAARMYPETDVPFVRVDKDRVKELRARLPPSFAERRKNYLKLGLGEDLAEKMLKAALFESFDSILKKTRAGGGKDKEFARFIAATLLETLTALRREGVEVGAISEDSLARVLELVARGKIVKAAVPELLKAVAVQPRAPVEKVVEEKKLLKAGPRELEALVKQFRGKPNAFEEIMRAHRLRVDAGELKKLLS